MENKKKRGRNNKKQTGRGQTGKRPIHTKTGGAEAARKQNGQRNPQTSMPDVLTEWFYMSDREMKAAALKEALEDMACQVEYWEEAQVLEIGLEGGGALDVEVIKPRLGEAGADAFLEEHQVRFLCYITFLPEHYEAARAVMEHISGRIGGFFCGDTEDFTPVIRTPAIAEQG